MNHTGYRAFSFTIYIFAQIFAFSAFGQSLSRCPNANFSLGDFSYWEGYYGDFWNPASHKGFAVTRHTIIKAPATFDANTCNELNPIPSGEGYSVRLGNDVGSQAEQLRYSVNVTEETNLFVYKYAVVMVDLPHNPDEQPNFTVEVADTSGNIIDPVCGSYCVYARHGIPTWHSCNDVSWKDWTTVGIDLTQYIGQTVSIIFTTRDCALGIHFGYAYLSAYCSKMQLTFDFCPNDTIATVTAPPGFSYLWSNGDTTQSRAIYNPVIGMADSCVLTSVTGCKVTVKGTLKPALVKAGFGCPQQNCLGDNVRFYDSSTVDPGVMTNWLWDFGDGSPAVANIQDPYHVYESVGNFNVTMIVSCDGGCPDTITKSLELISVPEIHFTISSPCDIDRGYKTLYFNDPARLNVAQGYDHYLWNTGDRTNSILVIDEGLYSVAIDNAGICYATDSVMMLHCIESLKMPDAFTPNDDGKNDLFRPLAQPEGITAFHIIIFDQWGGNIFESEDILRGWDGAIEERPAPAGVYVYTITYIDPSGETGKITGTVTLVR